MLDSKKILEKIEVAVVQTTKPEATRIWAGVKREGFKTFKALSVLRTLAAWWMILAVILVVEQAFAGTSWLSETIIVPFMIFQLVSALKNASMAGFINADILNKILDKIDGHKGNRK